MRMDNLGNEDDEDESLSQWLRNRGKEKLWNGEMGKTEMQLKVTGVK